MSVPDTYVRACALADVPEEGGVLVGFEFFVFDPDRAEWCRLGSFVLAAALCRIDDRRQIEC